MGKYGSHRAREANLSSTIYNQSLFNTFSLFFRAGKIYSIYLGICSKIMRLPRLPSAFPRRNYGYIPGYVCVQVYLFKFSANI